MLVTGGSGFIGRACLDSLQRKHFEVHAVSTIARSDSNGIKWHKADLLERGAPTDLLNALRPSMLLHLAWCAKPGQFWNSEENFLWLSASQELFRSFYFFGGQRALGLGTCAEFQWIGQNYNEQLTPSKPDTIYGRCKLAAALVLEAAAMAGGGSAAWARAFFPYGPGEPEGRFIPSLICGLLKGQTIPCSHGDQIRDFIYVTDVAEGLTELLCHEATGTFNLGTGRAVSLRHLANLITARLGHCELVQFGARAAPPGDPGRVVADMSRTFSVSGWRATVSLEQGIEHTITDWRERLHLQKEHG